MTMIASPTTNLFDPTTLEPTSDQELLDAMIAHREDLLGAPGNSAELLADLIAEQRGAELAYALDGARFAPHLGSAGTLVHLLGLGSDD